MPVVEVHLIEGYDAETKSRLGVALTQAVKFVLAPPPEAITILTHDIPSSGYMRGGMHRSPGSVAPDPSETVRKYLDFMEARDLESAKSLLGIGFRMTFPGDVSFTGLDDLVAWAGKRYRSVSKSYDRFDAMPGPEGAVVYCFGTLAGTWLDGTQFDGIRFIDRFEVVDGLLTRQDVWNDMAEMRNGRD